MTKEEIRRRVIDELNLDTDNLFTELLSHALAWKERCDQLKVEATRLRERVAHLERVQEAADAIHQRLTKLTNIHGARAEDRATLTAYDAVRKGEG